MQVNDGQRHRMIEEAAYSLAEKRGFAPGHEHEDWIAAERQVDEMLQNRGGAPVSGQQIQAAGDSGIQEGIRHIDPAQTGAPVEREKAAEGVTGAGFPVDQVVNDFSRSHSIKTQSATPNPAIEAAEAMNKSSSPEQEGGAPGQSPAS